MIRGLVPKERLLEWTVEDGWGPLCEFLGKPVPKEDEPFPHVNTAAGFDGQEARIGKKYVFGALKNLFILLSVGAAAGAVLARYVRGH